MPAIRGTLLDDESSEPEEGVMPQLSVAQSTGPMATLGELRGAASMDLTSECCSNFSMSNMDAVPSSKTMSIWMVAVAVLEPARSLRMLRRAGEHCSSPLSTVREVTWTVLNDVMMSSSSIFSRLRRRAPCRAVGGMHASAGVSCISRLKSATRSSGTSKALAIMDLGVTSKATDAELMPAAFSWSASVEVWSSIRRRVQFSSSEMSAKR
mmetsp:Transcript_28358/g.67223  ORF Transcript_28358/g.67223 Transcript_28358/m.67223 type:complete len:210 (-) Transcript_28358:840-1469(-)